MGVSFGPVGLLLFALFVMPFVILGWFVWFVVQVTVFIVREVRAARASRHPAG